MNRNKGRFFNETFAGFGYRMKLVAGRIVFDIRG